MKYLAITAILCLIFAGASFAGNVTMTEVITGGNLTLTMPDNFSIPARTLGGWSAVGPNIAETYTIEDSRGSGTGWNLGIQISQFTTTGTPARTIETTGFFTQGLQGGITKIWGQDIDSTYGPKTLMGSSNNVTNVEEKATQSSEGYGMGKYDVQLYHMLIFYAYIYAGTYTATLTATLNAVP